MAFASVGTQKSKAELLGIIEGIISDGAIVVPEAQFLHTWINTNFASCNGWPANVLLGRLASMLEDGELDLDEQRELLTLLCDVIETRKTADQQQLDAVVVSSKPVTVHSPFDDPPPTIEHLGRRFVITGEFACGKRADIVSAIESRGGIVAQNISRRIDYLIIGEFGSDAWIGGTYGTKIEAAIALRTQRVPIAIVGEKVWYESTLSAL